MKTRRVLTDRQSAVPALAEAFREHGFEGASLAVLSKATGLGKGSLYNFFPGGKEEMMAAVLDNIDTWFVDAIFQPLEDGPDPQAAIIAMFADVTAYFRSGRRVCIVGCLGLNTAGQAFSSKLAGYFARWISALAHCLEKGGIPQGLALALAEEAVSGIQGAIVLARALDEAASFQRIVARLQATLLAALAASPEAGTAPDTVTKDAT
ncbi:TetR/AcrR family transcriptional regulator [Novosphingobium capsulatum]|uniref:TetR/AcrR family transcriptional regulator n=1 Tax=Novosphingobium capsulatum TaxID=13688 RepID=UPI000786DF87|nr:TetR/AcrR family transcriptional regulator [Novosphingobium capsulatum]WQD95168.1 TetR/AcrR family transcriptional regulator [Novosphingobium capsulatum]